MSGSTPQRKITAHEIQSIHLHETRTIKVFIPPNYDPSVRYPIVYCHDGMEFFTHGRIATIANQRILEGKLRPLLIAGVAVSRTHRREDYAVDGERHLAYRRFVVDEVLPLVESLYAVDPELRFMAGISLGATAALSFSLVNPELFHQLLLFSGAFYPSAQAAAKANGDFSFLSAYMLVGRQETAVDTPNGPLDFYQFNHQMRDILRIRGAEIDYREADGTHIWGFWQSQLPDALDWINGRVQFSEYHRT